MRRELGRPTHASLLCCVVVLFAVAMPQVAEASGVTRAGATISVRDLVNERNDISISLREDRWIVRDSGFIVVGAEPACEQGPTLHEVSCAAAPGDSFLVRAGSQDDVVEVTGNVRAVVCAGSGDDLVLGGEGNDLIIGGAGADEIHGEGGADVLGDVPGTDTCIEDAPDDHEGDTFHGGTGNDIVDGTAGPDRVSAGSGDDTVFASAGEDRIDGGDGDDVLAGDAGDDAVWGGEGTDVLGGGEGSDLLVGGGGDDELGRTLARGGQIFSIENGNDHLAGGAGNDTLNGGPGAKVINYGDEVVPDYTTPEPNGTDRLSGGEGTDVVTYVNRTSPVSLSLDGAANDGAAGEGDEIDPDVEKLVGGTAADRMLGSFGRDVLDGGPGNDVVEGNLGDDDLTGGDGADVLKGNGGKDSVNGSGGDDDLIGGDGDDVLDGLGGEDFLDGGSGTDRLNGGGSSDTLRARGAGRDFVSCGPGPDLALLRHRASPPPDCEVADNRPPGRPLRGQISLRRVRGGPRFRPPGANRTVPLKDHVAMSGRLRVDAAQGTVTLGIPSRGSALRRVIVSGAAFQARGASLTPDRGDVNALCAADTSQNRSGFVVRARDGVRTRGAFSVASGRRAAWKVEERCDGTHTEVLRGRVMVRPGNGGPSVTLERGETHLAKRSTAR